MSNYEISKSSLLSLKAEILRKEEDLGKAKLENVEKIKTIKKKTPLELKNKGVEERRRNDMNDEELDLLKLSKSKLEAKAKLYEKLSGASNENQDLNKRYLVRFDKKDKANLSSSVDSEDIPAPIESEDEERHFSDEYDDSVDPSEEWVEYTDCFGRSRKCLRKDLEYFKSKEANLTHKTREQNLQDSENFKKLKETDKELKNSDQDIQSQDSTVNSELMSGDVRREILRQQWEKEEEELRNKADIHYQNVLFDEARQHGVGYYAFSKDEEERSKQQEALKKLREETEQQQKKAQDLKALREKQMAARMKAARNRRRARLGLPPEEDEPAPETKLETADNKKKEEEEKAAEEEKLQMEARKRHVRPWDIGKEGVTEHYEMTQEEWNEKKREERLEEFAPPKLYSAREFSCMQSLEEDFEEKDKSLKFSTKSSKGHKHIWNSSGKKYESLNPYKNKDYVGNRDEQLKNFEIFQNTKSPSLTSSQNDTNREFSDNSESEDSGDRLLRDYKKSQGSLSPSSATLRGLNPYKNYYKPAETPNDIDDNSMIENDSTTKAYTSTMAPIPIVNELEEVDFDDRLMDDYKTVMQGVPERVNQEMDRSKRRGVEIAPPPTFDYYGPEGGKRAKSSLGPINIVDSIEAGLQFLRKQAERKGRHCVEDI